jgi:hypothetical protein
VQIARRPEYLLPRPSARRRFECYVLWRPAASRIAGAGLAPRSLLRRTVQGSQGLTGRMQLRFEALLGRLERSPKASFAVTPFAEFALEEIALSLALDLEAFKVLFVFTIGRKFAEVARHDRQLCTRVDAVAYMRYFSFACTHFGTWDSIYSRVSAKGNLSFP